MSPWLLLDAKEQESRHPIVPIRASGDTLNCEPLGEVQMVPGGQLPAIFSRLTTTAEGARAARASTEEAALGHDLIGQPACDERLSSIFERRGEE